ncbi:MerR family transcriptional regulator [Pendulispora albinea]|uniref:MerR family transcriptional regulator n=1 Tax=Pendulispora albinea TaxID=2741071 RepID=A0ABZ2LW62_9BACT
MNHVAKSANAASAAGTTHVMGVSRAPVADASGQVNGQVHAQVQGPGAPRDYTIREVAAMTDVTVHTLRYYERIGLLAGVPRSASGHRRYGEDEVRWITFLRKIQRTGMPIRHMLEYARLMRRGDSTVGERRRLLEMHREEVETRLADLQANLEVIKCKIALYEEKERHTSTGVPFELAPTKH